MVRKYFLRFKNIILIIFSSIIITYIYKNINWIELKEIIKQANSLSLILAFSLSIFLGYISSIRYSYFSSIILPDQFPSIKTSTKSYFIASCFNLILPSKLGDLSKGFIAESLDNRKYPQTLQIFTLYEKVSDLFALISIALFISFVRFLTNYISFFSQEIYIYRQFILFFILVNFSLFLLLLFFLAPKNRNLIKSLHLRLPTKIKEILFFGKRLTWKEFYKFQLFSVLIWLIHIFQMLLFASSIGLSLWSLSGPFILIISTLIGLLPISFAGVGTRDASLVYFLAPYFGNTKPLFLGILLTSRYVIPAIFGLLFLREVKFKK
tara:strand:+ start:637 stop:1605 length:969 start_codon:yes stop_codon:yes gene_type:complete